MFDHVFSKFNSFALGTKDLTVENLPSRSRREFSYVADSSTLLVCLPGWGQEIYTWRFVKKFALKSNWSFLAYEFPREIFSDNATVTVETFNTINALVRKDIHELMETHKFTKRILIGISLASSFGSMVYENNPDITDIILIVPGSNLAKGMWTGCRTQHLRKSYEKQNVTLEELKNSWNSLHPESNIPHRNTNVEIFYGKNDKVIRYEESKNLAETMKSHRISLHTKSYRLGHYCLIFYFLFFPKRFLKNRSRLAASVQPA